MYAIFMGPVFRIPFKQAVTVVLFSFTFDLLSIRVFQFNILEIPGIEQDSFIAANMYLFIGLNCLIVAGYTYRYRFTYVSDLFFQTKIDKEENSEWEKVSTHLSWSLIILFLFDIFLYNVYVERMVLVAKVRISLTIWLLFLGVLLVSFF